VDPKRTFKCPSSVVTQIPSDLEQGESYGKKNGNLNPTFKTSSLKSILERFFPRKMGKASGYSPSKGGLLPLRKIKTLKHKIGEKERGKLRGPREMGKHGKTRVRGGGSYWIGNATQNRGGNMFLKGSKGRGNDIYGVWRDGIF